MGYLMLPVFFVALQMYPKLLSTTFIFINLTLLKETIFLLQGYRPAAYLVQFFIVFENSCLFLFCD